MNGVPGYEVGTRVRNLFEGSCVPRGCLGTVVDGPACTYGVTVQWDGYEMKDSYGERGWRPYWATRDLAHEDRRLSAVFDPCPRCGKGSYYRVYTGIPGRAMGGGWVRGGEMIECTCGARLYYATRN